MDQSVQYSFEPTTTFDNMAQQQSLSAMDVRVLQDEFGTYRADAKGSVDPLPGLNVKQTYHWSEYFKYVNRWYYKDVKKPEKGKNVPIYPYRDCPSTCPMRIRWADPSAPMFSPFGLQAGLDPSKTESRMTLDVCVEDPALLAACAAFDARNLQMAYENRVEWFDADEGLSLDMLRYGYNKHKLANLKKSKKNPEKSKTYKPLMRFKVNVTGPDAAKVYVQTDTRPDGSIVMREGNFSDLTKFCNIVPIADFKGNWIMNNEFGPLIILHSVLVVPAVRRQDDFANDFGSTAIVASGNESAYGAGGAYNAAAAGSASSIAAAGGGVGGAAGAAGNASDDMQVDGAGEDVYADVGAGMDAMEGAL